MSDLWKEDLKEVGFAVVPGVLNSDEVKKLSGAFDQVVANLSTLEKTGKPPFDVRYTQVRGKKAVYFVRWAAFVDEDINRFRLHPAVMKIVSEVLGENLKQITNQMHLKLPGDGVYFPMHQDSAFRKPNSAYRNLYESFLQTIVAVDRATEENGCLYFYPKSHRPPKDLLSYEGELFLATAPAILGHILCLPKTFFHPALLRRALGVSIRSML